MSTNPKFYNTQAHPYYHQLVELYFEMKGHLYKNGIVNKKDYATAVEKVRKLANYLYFKVIKAKPFV